ncbi:hypothetical protein MCOR27_009877 [Pyricularia oryzae]|uniref:Uncharacterized protein n=1 Tax=Pyricularia oryzae TaxID=318829 RepID=A0A4V1C6K5_PYROR|nr:hypothetical protein MCOR01_005325 [Pyricularia oryzae]KAI6254966.1 hypothetical protein MCOR19_008532 [Pyricularia oryzae]KAI6268410.1 hypothetical protein MCOR26_009226 [Pyricularia oryzae]KAI6269134.1 hypothetical protein MCOR27_009877 [Pyricularia oryzae]KAI6297125.1 hypothetical protein MCOR34_009392 [Pyricularia oryzae]
MRYESLEGGSESVDVAVGEDATFVGVNTPATLLKYNGNIPNITEAARGLDYTISVAGATAAKFG